MTDAPLDPRDRELDAALRALFTPPPLDAVVAEVHALTRTPPTARWRWPLIGLLAAAGLLAGLMFWLNRSRTVDAESLPQLWAAAYHDAVSRGMNDRSCCDGSADLRTMCRAMFAAGLDLEADADVTMCGCYRGGPTGGAVAALMHCGGESVCVFVLPLQRAPASMPERVDGLRVHRRDVGGLVAYELSPHDEPRALPHLIASRS